MTPFQRKIALRVISVHAALIFLMIVIPAIKGCFRPRPKEIVTFIEFGGPAPQVSIEEVSQMAEPEPPAPEPEPAPVPEPVKPKPKPKPTEKKPEPKPEPKPKKPEEPKWKATKPEDINPNKSKRIVEKPSKPAVTSSEIKKALSGISSGPTGDPSQFNDYYAQVISLFYSRWTPPASATSATGSAIVKISMRKNGRITKRAKIKGSGDPLYDRTVMDAVNAVSTMPKPPSNYPYDYVEVTFTLDN